MPYKQLIVCDLDNTLYDWVGYFVPSFYAMVDATVRITDCDRETLLDDFRKVHQRYGDSEQPFALMETDTIKRIYQGVPAASMIEALDPAFHAFNSVRKKSLKLHPYVRQTLELLKASDIKMVAHTESKLYGVLDRLDRLDLFQFFEKVYCRERSLSSHPTLPHDPDWMTRFPVNKIIELSHHQTKPNPTVLLEICGNEKIAPERVSYIGDSMARDILMAKRANIFSIWAAYGAEHDPSMYKALVRISHWTREEIIREQKLKEEARIIEPDYVARHSFAEVLGALEIVNTPLHRIVNHA